ncbi:MAG: hypothetical protein KTR13_00545 [Saprospiraceae bacterium]|nr:hypothetical protein [Saprospiraceae bacterium]
MKGAKFLFFLIAGFFILPTQAQNFDFSDVVDFQYRGAGSITNKNEVQGYFIFFEKDRLSEDSTEFIVKILDQNLNELTEKTITAEPSTGIESVLFNGKSLMIKQFYPADKLLNFKVSRLDISGELTELGTEEIEQHKNARSHAHSIPGEGYVNVYGDKKGRAKLEYFGDDGNSWRYETPEDVKFEYLDYVATDSSTIIFSAHRHNPVTAGDDAIEGIINKDHDGRGDYYLKAFDLNTGEILYDKVMTFGGFDYKIDRGFVNPIKDEVWITGDYFEKGHSEEAENSQGLFIMKITPDGEILDSDFIPWDGKINRYSASYKKGKLKKGFLHFHDFVFLENGQVFGIAEQYRKAFRAWGVAERAVTAGMAGHLTKVIVGDMFVFEFGNDAKLVKSTRARKPEKDHLPGKGPFGSLLIPGKKIGDMLTEMNAYNFSHASVNNESTKFTVFYYMKEDLTKKQEKQYRREGRWILRTVGYQDRAYSKDKIYLTDGKKEGAEITVLPAKPGYVLIHEESPEYSGLRLEKIK